MKRLIVLSTILSLGFAASAWACDGDKAAPPKDGAPQTQTAPKSSSTSTAPVKTSASVQTEAGSK